MRELAGDAARGAGDRSQRAGRPPVVVEVGIISDVVCPWCFIAKRRLERAVASLPEGVTAAVRWLPFELNPEMPPEGMDRREYRTRKFGSWERSRGLDAEVAAVGAREGIGFRHDLIGRTPNTRAAHRLIWLAGREGLDDALVEAIFRAYFLEGRDVGDPAVLAELAAGAGVARGRAEAFLAGDEGADAVARAELDARRAGVSGVPTFVLDGEQAFSGAQRAELMRARLLAAAGGAAP